MDLSKVCGFIVHFIGFKAHKSYDSCLKHHNDTLMAAFNSIDEALIPEDRIITYMHPETGISLTTNLPECSLQKELDNVSRSWPIAFYPHCTALHCTERFRDSPDFGITYQFLSI
jgi:hypothetical protein